MSKEESESPKSLVSELKKQTGGTNIIKEYKDIFSNSNGSDLKNDSIAENPEEALALLKKLMQEKKESIKKESKRKKWNFETSPHEEFGKTIDDTYLAFLEWARVKQDRSKINVSKALRRVETYADWMHDTEKDLIEPKLTTSSVRKALGMWGMNTSYDKEGSLLWWCDMSKIDVEKNKKELTPEESLRAFVWYAHAIMYDKNAQENGILFIQNLNKLGMVACFTMMPAKLSTKLDKLTIGVLPVKMKGVYMLETPTWVVVFMKIVGIFMSKKMKERVVIWKDWSQLEKTFGLEVTPKVFGKVNGKLEEDVIEKTYLSQ